MTHKTFATRALLLILACATTLPATGLSEKTLGMIPIRPTAAINDFTNVKDEFGEGNPRVLIAAYLNTSLVEELGSHTTFRSVTLCPEAGSCGQDLELRFEDFRLYPSTRIKTTGYLRNLNLSTSFRITEVSTGTAVTQGVLNVVVESNYNITIKSWEDLTDEMSESILSHIPSPVSLSTAKLKAVIFTAATGVLLLGVPVTYLNDRDLSMPLLLSIAGVVTGSIAISRWIKYRRLQNSMAHMP